MVVQSLVYSAHWPPSPHLAPVAPDGHQEAWEAPRAWSRPLWFLRHEAISGCPTPGCPRSPCEIRLPWSGQSLTSVHWWSGPPCSTSLEGALKASFALWYNGETTVVFDFLGGRSNVMHVGHFENSRALQAPKGCVYHLRSLVGSGVGQVLGSPCPLWPVAHPCFSLPAEPVP